VLHPAIDVRVCLSATERTGKLNVMMPVTGGYSSQARAVNWMFTLVRLRYL